MHTRLSRAYLALARLSCYCTILTTALQLITVGVRRTLRTSTRLPSF